MAVKIDRPQELYGATVLGENLERLGRVETVFLDTGTDRPEWAAVSTGFFGVRVSLVPLARASFDGDALRVPYGKDDVKKAPHHDPDQALSVEEERELYDHYDIPYEGGTAPARPADGAAGRERDTDRPEGGVTDRHTEGRDRAERAVGRDTSGPTTDDAMTRSEEELHVGTETRERGRARLRKYVDTDTHRGEEQISEEVRKEQIEATEGTADAASDAGRPRR